MIEPSAIKKARSSLGLTQKELASESGVSQSLIAKIEAGCLDPTYSKVRDIDAAIKRLSKKSEKTASQVMAKSVIFSRESDNILKIIKVMSRHSISQVPVIENNKLIGLVTESSILENSAKPDFHSLCASDIITEPPPIVSGNTPMSVVSEILRHSPIVLISVKGDIKGVITKADIIKSQAY